VRQTDFAKRVINAWNSLPPPADENFSSLVSLKGTIRDDDFSGFLSILRRTAVTALHERRCRIHCQL